jgi:very-short-patch-repair endonuclease
MQNADGLLSYKAAKVVVSEYLVEQLRKHPELLNDTVKLKAVVRALVKKHPGFQSKHVISAVTGKLITQAKTAVKPPSARCKPAKKRKKRLTPGLTPAQAMCQLKMAEAMERKRELRRRATPAEIRFAEVLRGAGVPFVSQAVIFTAKGYFIADFRVSAGSYKLIVEIDGGYHKERGAYDEWRTEQILKTHTYRSFQLVRFTNEQVLSGEFVAEMKRLRPKPFAKREQEFRDGKIASLPWRVD